MAACTLALSPSSAKVAVCKRTFLRASSHGPTRTQRITGAASATESAGVAATKGPNGKGQSLGKGGYESDPLRPSVGRSMAQFACRRKHIRASLRASEVGHCAAGTVTCVMVNCAFNLSQAIGHRRGLSKLGQI